MEKVTIHYSEIEHDEYKYQLQKTYEFDTKIRNNPSKSTFIELSKKGILTIKEGYSWDGPSGPALDLKCMMRASLVHDALYQMLREGRLGQGWRKRADIIFKEICIEDDMPEFAAEIAYWALRHFAWFAAIPDNEAA